MLISCLRVFGQQTFSKHDVVRVVSCEIYHGSQIKNDIHGLGVWEQKVSPCRPTPLFYVSPKLFTLDIDETRKMCKVSKKFYLNDSHPSIMPSCTQKYGGKVGKCTQGSWQQLRRTRAIVRYLSESRGDKSGSKHIIFNVNSFCCGIDRIPRR